jgi:hypothetical protein
VLQRAAIGEALSPLPDVPLPQNLGAASFACAISSHIPPVHAPFVSLLALVVPRSSGSLDLDALCHELLQKMPEVAPDSDSLPLRSNVLQRYCAVYEKLVKQFMSLVSAGSVEAAGEIIQAKGQNSLDDCVQRISNALLQVGVPSSHIVFYGLPLSITSCKKGSPLSRAYFKDSPSQPDHWCVVNSAAVGSFPQVWVAWRQDAAYFFMNGLGESMDRDGFTASLAALRDVMGTVSDSGGECGAAGSERVTPSIDVIATCRSVVCHVSAFTSLTRRLQS